MDPRFETFITLDDGTEVLGKVMYIIVWEGKAISGEETLVRGDRIASIRIERKDERT